LAARLDRTSKLAAGALAIGLVVLTATTVLVFTSQSARDALGLGPQTGPAYKIGERVDLQRSILEGEHATVVVFSRSACSSCQASKPLLSLLARDVAGRPDVAMILVAPRLSDAELAYADEIGVRRSSVRSADPLTVRAKVTPTVLVVDRSGHVQFAHEGRLSGQDAETIRTLIRTEARSAR